jgi:HK97 family phage major capsid protein
MPNLRQIEARKAEIQQAVKALQARSDDLTDQDYGSIDAWEQELSTLAETERRQKQLIQLDLAAAGRPLNGSPPSPRLEVRAFAEGPSAVPEGFDGMILRGQDGTRIPVLEARHRLVDFLPPSESRATELGLGGFLRALYGGPQTELERRVLAEASVGAGGAFVPTPLSAEVIDLLRARAVAFQAGVRTIPMTSQTLKFARVTADPVGGWRAENASIAVSDPTFDAPSFAAKNWALIVKGGREVFEDAPNLDAELRAMFARVAALALDGAILWGTGSSNQPTGVANTSGIQVVSMATNGAAFTGWTPVLDAVAALETANVTDITAMVFAPRTARTIYGLVDAMNQPLQPPPRIAAIPRLVTSAASIAETQGTASTASSILLGDFSQVFVGMRTALQINVLNERYADTGQVAFVLWMRADVAVAHPAALARIQGIIP